jgi:uncharacterized protein
MKEKIRNDMKQAMREKNSKRLDVIRLMLADIQRKEVDERITLDDAQVFDVLNKMIKQRRDSATQYLAAGRADLAEQENYEIDLVQTYLPTPLSDIEIDQCIKEAISETGANSVRDMGKVMGILKPKIQGRADMGAVSNKVRTLLP